MFFGFAERQKDAIYGSEYKLILNELLIITQQKELMLQLRQKVLFIALFVLSHILIQLYLNKDLYRNKLYLEHQLNYNMMNDVF